MCMPKTKFATRLFMTSLAAVAVAASLAIPSFPRDRPFTRGELLEYMRANLPAWTHPEYSSKCEKLAKLIRQRGIDFEASLSKFDEELHKAGANTTVKIALSESYRDPTAAGPFREPGASEPAGEGLAQPSPPSSRPAGASIAQPGGAVPARPAQRQQPAADSGNMDWRVGDEVEAWINVDWLPAKIVQVGGGPFPENPYKVQYGAPIRGNYTYRWLSPGEVRAPRKFSSAAVTASGPRPGRYTILSYGSPARPPIRIGYIDLDAGTYRYLSAAGHPLGEGRFAFDETAGAVQWQSGPLKDQGWSGTFSIERDGKTHKIRLMRSTIATNSTD